MKNMYTHSDKYRYRTILDIPSGFKGSLSFLKVSASQQLHFPGVS